MGHKGVSKRKPKKISPHSNGAVSNSSNIQNGGRSPVAALVNDRSAPPNKGSLNPLAGSNKTRKNH
jgi:hypothetical protein